MFVLAFQPAGWQAEEKRSNPAGTGARLVTLAQIPGRLW